MKKQWILVLGITLFSVSCEPINITKLHTALNQLGDELNYHETSFSVLSNRQLVKTPDGKHKTIKNKKKAHDVYADPKMGEPIPMNEEEKERLGNISIQETTNVSEGLDQAKHFFEKAYQQTELDILLKAQKYLNNADLNLPPRGRTYRPCRQGALAFVIFSYGFKKYPKQNIFICSRVRTYNPKKIAQIIVHETGHLIGLSNECSATLVEIGGMNLAGESLTFHNGYFNRCGFRDDH